MPASRIHALVIAFVAMFAMLLAVYADAAGASAKQRQHKRQQHRKARASALAVYVNPFGRDRYVTGRTDMGVDFCLRPGAPIRTVGNAVVVGINPGWFAGQPYIWYRLLDGPDAGRYVYVAEQITRLAPVGARIRAGRPVAYYAGSGTCIETGWSAANGATLAQATTGYYEGEVTPAGVSFARFLHSLGVRVTSG